MKIPSVKKANKILKKSGELNHGKWVKHSKNTALAARVIADNLPELDSDKAYVLGLLHDIGRREGKCYMKHMIYGYKYLKAKEYDDAASICLTHSFPINDINLYQGKNDLSKDETDFLTRYIEEHEYTDYDKLIQLCDCLSLPTGCCLIEKRLVEISLKHGVNKYTTQKWNKIFEIKGDFEKRIGSSIYSIIPGVFETTFDLEYSLFM